MDESQVMSVECENACFKVEHDLFCTNCPGLGVLSHIRQFADRCVVSMVFAVGIFQRFSDFIYSRTGKVTDMIKGELVGLTITHFIVQI